MTTTAPAAPGPLTPRQAEVLAYLYETTRDTGIQPSLRDVAGFLGSANPRAAAVHLEALQRKGWVEGSRTHSRLGSRSRALKFLRTPSGAAFTGFLDKPSEET